MGKSKVTANENVTIEFKDKIIVLSFEPFDTDINIDEFTQIHFYNIMCEILTASVALNRIGIMLAEYNQILSEANLDFDIFYAQQFEKFQKDLMRLVVTSRSERNEKPSSTEIDQAIIRTPEYKIKRMNVINIKRNKEIIESFYWAVQDKCKKLQHISDKLRPEEFEKDIVEEKINGIVIKKVNKAIK